MIKYFCDCCGKETKSLEDFTYYIHIEMLNCFGYINGEGDGQSGRKVNREVCQKCYNRIMQSAYATYKVVQNESNI